MTQTTKYASQPAVADVLDELEALGNAKVRERNSRLGAGSDQFGVLMGDIRKVAAKHKNDHELGLALWSTGNLEARHVAILLLRPKSLTADDVDSLVRDASFGPLADWLSSYIIKNHPESETLRLRWLADPDPWAARAGWSLTAGRAERSPEGLDLDGLLDRIATEMPTADPATQWTMNNSLAAIGINHPQLRQRAIDIGEKLGIYRDYPVPKGCTSPFAPIWISEMVKRQA